MDKELTIDVPIRLINTPVGVSNGGILQHVRREIAISCLPDKLVDFIEMDVSKLDIGESLHIRDIELPEGITSLQEEKLTVAVVNAPSVSAEEEEIEEIEEEEGKEPEEVTESDSQDED
jgi:large subunit ribosomal protein L25